MCAQCARVSVLFVLFVAHFLLVFQTNCTRLTHVTKDEMKFNQLCVSFGIGLDFIRFFSSLETITVN